MKLTKKEITIVTVILASVNVFINIYWFTHQNINHRPLVLINIMVALLLGALVIYVRKRN